MSLLTEALKKSAQAKQRAGGASPASPEPAAETSLSSAPKSVLNALPDIEFVDVNSVVYSAEPPVKYLELDTQPNEPIALADPPAKLSELATKQNTPADFFATKKNAATRSTWRASWIFGSVAVLGALLYFGVSFYPSLIELKAAKSVAAQAEAVLPTPIANQHNPQQEVLQDTDPQSAEINEPSTLSPTLADEEEPEARPPKRTIKKGLTDNSHRPQKPLLVTAPLTDEPDTPLRLSKSLPKTNQTLERAYDALQAGHLDKAQRAYEQLLQTDAKNTDVLLGLATLATRRAQAEKAHEYYLRALDSDPSNATAWAGVLNAAENTDPELLESRLKTALTGQANSAALSLALGNLYARQSRWADAQQAYFQAYSNAPDNIDCIFNLAVSLDHLHQNKLAAQYYQMALSLSEKTLAVAGASEIALDSAALAQRLRELQP